MGYNWHSKSLIVTVGPWHEKPWWWDYIEESIQGCNVQYVRITTLGNKKEGQLSIRHLPRLAIKIIKYLRKYQAQYIFTFECGVASFIVAALQTIGFMRKMKHIILQFIMREQEPTLRSRLKYLFLRLVLSSIDTAVCSSTGEISYYRKAFRWNEDKTRFVPCYFDPVYLNAPLDVKGGFILTAGRTFRDYETFFDAISETGVKAIVVASKHNIKLRKLPSNVLIKYDIKIDELTELMKKSSLVVVPLEDRRISIGQSVFLQAMAMGKAVVVTKTAGTIDYIDHLENGMLVPPGDSQQMREAIQYLIANEEERFRIGKNAKQSVLESCLPIHYFEKVRQLVYEKEALKEKSRDKRNPPCLKKP